MEEGHTWQSLSKIWGITCGLVQQIRQFGTNRLFLGNWLGDNVHYAMRNAEDNN
jgi:hypothetical protein